MSDSRFLAALKEMFHEGGYDNIYPCIQDLVEHALDPSRFSPGDQTPNRQDITHYLATWCRHAGLTEAACRSWMTEYCAERLAPISKTSAAGIRHSTKSNVKYIYQAGIVFVCEREQNRFRAACAHDCPAYAGMPAIIDELRRERSANLKERLERTALPPPMSVKQIHQEQFNEALQLVRRELELGADKSAILALLNERGMKTRTGRPWTTAILTKEIGSLKETPAGNTADRESEGEAM